MAKVSDKPEWNLNGQILSLAFPITDQVVVMLLLLLLLLLCMCVHA